MKSDPSTVESSAGDRLPPGQNLVAENKWPTIGEKSPRDSTEPWTISICGLVEEPLELSLSQLQEMPQQSLTLDIHCVTRWSKFDVTFSGVLLADLLELAGVKPSARYASFVARSSRSHSTSLLLEDALR